VSRDRGGVKKGDGGGAHLLEVDGI